MKNPQKKYRVDFLKQLLDDKLSYLIHTLEQQQKENFNIEHDALNRLNILKTLNTEIEEIHCQQSQQTEQLKKQLTQKTQEHNHEIEQDQEKLQLEDKLKELQKNLFLMRQEVENQSIQNEKLKMSKEERLSRDLNSRVFADHKQNE